MEFDGCSVETRRCRGEQGFSGAEDDLHLLFIGSGWFSTEILLIFVGLCWHSLVFIVSCQGEQGFSGDEDDLLLVKLYLSIKLH